jgi:deazaflavin-dependent oxidoreductase (nitroreductase family)
MRLSNTLVHAADRITRSIYTWSHGRIGHHQMGWTMLLLTTIGHKSGAQRTHTLLYLCDGDRLLIVASNNGADQQPGWYLNLLANPRVYVRYGRNTGPFRARVATAAERAELWPRLVAYHPPYAKHQAHTRRELPVVILTPAAG